MESRKTDIFSTFVFINLGNLSLNFNSPFFSMTLAVDDWISDLFSIRYDFARFPLFIANPFCFCYIMESRFLFFVSDPVFQSNSPYLNGIERLDILTLNNEPLFVSNTYWRGAASGMGAGS